MNFRKLIFIFSLHAVIISSAFCQSINIDLEPKSDTLANSFTLVLTGKNDIKSNIEWNTSKFASEVFTTSRSLYLKSIDQMLGVLIGQSRNGKFIVFDKNMNTDFADDEVIYFTDTINSSSKRNYRTLTVNVKNLEGGLSPITFDYTIIKPRALNLDLGDSLENKFFFAYRNRDYYFKQAMIGDRKVYFYVIPKKPLDFTYSSVKLFATDSLIDFKKANSYRVGDKITLDGAYYAINNISSDGLKMNLLKITGEKPIGINVGFFVPKLSFNTIAHKKISLADLSTQYTLLEFWGTWCGPCKAVLPSLKNLYENKKDNLTIISIAYNDKLELVKQHTQENGVRWNQVLNAKDGNADFAKDYQIDSFPSFLLLDASGKIVFKDSGLNGFDNLKVFIETKLK